ncbi:hypothetical protein SDC9_176900 [bioreactor metagenome]|uniref:Uncharacterized protein n=1 Tax=bioreactor metagenome TaxID=1076179 RepID=A0A645GRB6_9ZZZZ|nr:hypothetical protein [Lutispora sp.]MEA4960936.1 hypothetical protein [Lutispora sp.]HCJ58185.1 hypothetical protein [Clostridiaceae bacterium]
MTNEEFQKFVVEKLGKIESEVKDVKAEALDLKTEVAGIKTEVADLKKEVAGIKNHTASLMEFRTEVNAKLDAMIEDNKSIHELLGEHEVSIRTLRRRPV